MMITGKNLGLLASLVGFFLGLGTIYGALEKKSDSIKSGVLLSALSS